MSMHDCITQGVLEGVLSREEGDALHQAHARHVHAAGGADLDGGPAARATFDAFEAELAAKRRQKLLAAQAQLAADFDMRSWRDEFRRGSLTQGARALFDSQAFPSAKPGAEVLRETIRGDLHRTLARAFQKFERNLIGDTRNKALLSEIVDALHGSTHVSEGARQIAAAWRIAAEKARRMFNEAGGHIGFREDWGLPQGHDWEQIAAAGPDEWMRFLLENDLLDRARMIDGRTGQPFSDAQLELTLRDTWEAISTEGWSRRQASGQRGGRSIGNSRADPRFLIFRDGAAWRAYMERFGEGDPFKVMMDYLDGMARDIALMQRFGPNPGAGVEFIKQTLQREASLAKDPKAKLDAEHAADELETMFQQMTGAASVPSHKAFASWSGEARQWLVSAQLGGAMLSAVSDIGFQQITAAFNGLPGARIVARQMALMVPTNHADREIAIGLGLIAEEAAGVLSTQQRHYGEAWGSGVAQRFADGVLKASGLSAWTQAGRWAFGMEFLAFMARQSDRELSDLPKPLARTLKRYGFTPETWAQMRGAAIEKGGTRFIDTSKLADEKLAQRVMAMVRTETNYAVPSVSLYGKSKFAGGGRPGTISGELVRSFMMYKNFGITLLFTHGRRAAMQTTWRGRVGYGGAMVATATLLGAMSLQLKEIAKGRDPRPMTGEKFWLAAMAQGGGMGILGDFLFSDTNRFGAGWGETIAGPVVGLAFDTAGMAIGNARAMIQGDDPKWGKDLTGLLESYTPGGSLWYARLAYQRILLDQVREMVDPDAGDYQERLRRRYERDYNQDYWWAPGAMAPRAAPDVGNVAAPEAE
jgi:hypothetical protein